MTPANQLKKSRGGLAKVPAMRHAEGERMCMHCTGFGTLRAPRNHSEKEPMIRPELLQMLVCPEDRTPLEAASSELVAIVNDAVAAGRLTNRAGRKVERRLDAGLVRSDRTVLYPVVDEIPMLLVDEAIPLDQPAIQS